MKNLIIFMLCIITVFSAISCDSQTNAKIEQPIDVVIDNITNPNYIKYVDTNDIEFDIAKLDKKYVGKFSKYISFIAPNGKPINILAQNKVSNEQLLKAYNILSFYLTSHKGYDMDAVANNMADNGAWLMMPNGVDGDKKLNPFIYNGQPLFQMEVPVTGDKWYIENDYNHRDASYEEILHLVHDYGIGTKSNKGALPELQQAIYEAMDNALPYDQTAWGKDGLWGYDSKEWLLELSKEGSLEQEYIVSVVDSYYGLWEAFSENSGGMYGVYIAKNRVEIIEKDPVGYEVLTSFLLENFNYMDRISKEFDGTFYLSLDENSPYTYKSQYIVNARLTGQNDSNIEANNLDNILIGNKGNNIIDGKGGYDIVQLSGASEEYTIEGNVITDNLMRDGKDTLLNIELVRFTDKDIEF